MHLIKNEENAFVSLRAGTCEAFSSMLSASSEKPEEASMWCIIVSKRVLAWQFQGTRLA